MFKCACPTLYMSVSHQVWHHSKYLLVRSKLSWGKLSSNTLKEYNIYSHTFSTLKWPTRIMWKDWACRYNPYLWLLHGMRSCEARGSCGLAVTLKSHTSHSGVPYMDTLVHSVVVWCCSVVLYSVVAILWYVRSDIPGGSTDHHRSYRSTLNNTSLY